MHAIDQTTAFGVGVDAAGDVFVGGTTTAASFPTTAAYQPSPASTSCLTVANTQGACADAFVIKVAPAGDLLLYSTFLGGTGWDAGQALAVDPAGDAFLAGYTYSTDFPAPNAPPGAGAQHSGAGPCDASALAITEPPCGDAFLAELDPDGTSLAYGLYLGGGDFDAANAVTVDQAGDAVAGGVTDSTDFPTVHPVEGPQSGSGCASLGGAAGACGDGFVVKIAPDRIGSPTPTASPTTTPTPVPTATRTAIPPTATPTKTKAPIHKCPRNATKKHGKCACKKGYKMVKGKCRKVKKHH